MIELPSSPAPRDAVPELLDYGMHLTPATGAKILRVDRAGSRFAIAVQYPKMTADEARVFISRLLRAKNEGVRIPYPLQGVGQGNPGTVLVDGANQEGTRLKLRAVSRGYRFKEGFWLSIEDGSGQHYLHNCAQNFGVGDDEVADIAIWPPLRVPFDDGNRVHIAKPMIEGVMTGSNWSWGVPLDKLPELEFTITEAE